MADELDAALAGINKAFGKGAIYRLGDDSHEPVAVIPTGSLALDKALGIGGLPRGRMVEIFGPEMSGKTTVALHVAANAQRAGGNVAFIDAEHSLDPERAQRLGVNTDDLLVSQPDTGEQGLEIADRLVRSGAVSCLIVDSVAALVPRAEIEGDMGDAHVGLHARLMGQACRKLTGPISRTDTVVIFINQIRQKVGVVYGSPEVTTGGKGLPFFCSVRLDIRRIEQIKDGDEVVGNKTRVKVVKNKLAAPFKVAEFGLYYERGIDREAELIDLGVKYGIITQKGSWFSYDGNQIGQGKENARQTLLDHPASTDIIENQIREKMNG